MFREHENVKFEITKQEYPLGAGMESVHIHGKNSVNIEELFHLSHDHTYIFQVQYTGDKESIYHEDIAFFYQITIASIRSEGLKLFHFPGK